MQSPSGQVRRLTKLYGGCRTTASRTSPTTTTATTARRCYQFKITETGAYRVLVGADSNAPAGADIAFGESIASGTIAAGLLIVGGVLLLITAIILLIVGLVKRSRHKNSCSPATGGTAGTGGTAAAIRPARHPVSRGRSSRHRRRRRAVVTRSRVILTARSAVGSHAE